MAEDIEQNIIISADGSAAVESLDDVSGALETLRDRFQHVGVHIFGQEMLHAMGMTGNLRPLIMALQASVTALGSAFGGAVAAALPYVAIAAALAAAIYQLSKSHAESSAEIQKHIQSLDADIKSTNEFTASIGHATAESQSLLNSLRALKTAELQREIKALSDEIENFSERANNATGFFGKGATSIADQDIAFQKLQLQLKKTTMELDAMKHGYESAADQAKLTADAKVAEGNRVASMLEFENSTTRKTMADIARYQNDQKAAAQQAAQQTAQAWENNLQPVGNAIGQAFVQSATTGKSALKSLEQSFIQMAEQMMAKLIGLIALWTILDILSGGTASGAGGTGSTLGSQTGGLGSFMKRHLGFATGIDTFVDRPMPFIAGEGGPEHVSVTPLGSKPSESSQSSPSIGAVHINLTANGVNDPVSLANQVGQELAKIIRGGGQLSLQRS